MIYIGEGRVLVEFSSAYSLRYYLHSIVAMIIFLRILSWEDFVPGGFCPLSMHFNGLLDDFHEMLIWIKNCDINEGFLLVHIFFQKSLSHFEFQMEYNFGYIFNSGHTLDLPM